MDSSTLNKLLAAADKVDRLESLLARIERHNLLSTVIDGSTSPHPSTGAGESTTRMPPVPSTLPAPATAPTVVPTFDAAREATLVARIAQLEAQNRVLQQAVVSCSSSSVGLTPCVDSVDTAIPPKSAATTGAPNKSSTQQTTMYAKRSTRSASVEMELFEAHIAKGVRHAEAQAAAAAATAAAESHQPIGAAATNTAEPAASSSRDAIPSASPSPSSSSSSTKAAFRLLRADSRQCEYTHVGNGRISLGVRSTNLVRLNWAPKDEIEHKQPQHVLIIKKPGDHEVAQALYDVALWLQAHHKTVWVEPNVHVEESTLLPFLHTWSGPHELVDLHLHIDLIVCLGGDGTLLWASNLFKTSVPPVISFSLGSLGFLSPFPIDRFEEALTKVFAGGFHLTLRSRLVCTIVRGRQTSGGGGIGGTSRRTKVELQAGTMGRGVSEPLANHNPATTSETTNDSNSATATATSENNVDASSTSPIKQHTVDHPHPSMSIAKARHYSLSAQGFPRPVDLASPTPTPVGVGVSEPVTESAHPIATHSAALSPPPTAVTPSPHLRSHNSFGGGQSIGVELVVDDAVDVDCCVCGVDGGGVGGGLPDVGEDEDFRPPAFARSETGNTATTDNNTANANTNTTSASSTERTRRACTHHDDTDALSADDVESYVCMNEVIIDRGLSAYLTLLDCYVDGMLFTRCQADGIIVGTPTGSTAYSLSAGGSMCHPEVPCMLFTPVCPHSLSFRPLLFPDTSTLQIKVSSESRGANCASFDGRHRAALNPGDSLLISMSRWPLPSICRLDGTTDWFDGVRSVLQWNSRTASQKSFLTQPNVANVTGTAPSNASTGATPAGVTTKRTISRHPSNATAQTMHASQHNHATIHQHQHQPQHHPLPTIEPQPDEPHSISAPPTRFESPTNTRVE